MSVRAELPLAIAVVRCHRAMSPQEWRRARTAVAHRVTSEGYALLETFDVVGAPMLDESVYDAVEAISARSEVSALIVSGEVDRCRVDGIAGGFGMVVLPVPLPVEVSAQGGITEPDTQEASHV